MADIQEMSKSELVAALQRSRGTLARNRAEERQWGESIVAEGFGFGTAALMGAVDARFGEGSIMGANPGAVLGIPVGIGSVFLDGAAGAVAKGVARGCLYPEAYKAGGTAYTRWAEGSERQRAPR